MSKIIRVKPGRTTTNRKIKNKSGGLKKTIRVKASKSHSRRIG